MKSKYMKYVAPPLIGACISTAFLALSRLLIQYSGRVFSLVSNIMKQNPSVSEAVIEVLNQLTEAEFSAPWAAFILIGAVVFLLIRLIKFKSVRIILTSLFILSLIPSSIYFTFINGVRFGNLIRAALGLFSNLL
ncbi:MAG: hypothetical protein IJC48_01840 [Clostridia bacterium]|nr:hypothetical protein [Clostridia bacterium]